MAHERSYAKYGRSYAKFEPMSGRVSVQAASETRQTIVRAAATLASVEGLDGVTVGRLATELDMSKSGVIGQFGTKEKLQVATVEFAFAVFVDRVWAPVKHEDAGLPRLLAVCRSWTSYAAAPGFPGGCCVARFTVDFGARSGAVHDRIALGLEQWRATLVSDIATARESGDIPSTVEPEQAAFALESIAAGMNPARLIHRNADVANWALRAMHTVLGLPDSTGRSDPGR